MYYEMVKMIHDTIIKKCNFCMSPNAEKPQNLSLDYLLKKESHCWWLLHTMRKLLG